jgi:hypothetical protein
MRHLLSGRRLLRLAGAASLIAGMGIQPVQASVDAGDRNLAGVGEAWAGVDAIAPDDVWAVGTRSDSAPLLKHWDGTRWRLASAPGGIQRLSGIDHPSSTDVWVGGQGGVIHWDGSSWAKSYDTDDLTVIQSIVALGTDDVWATGFRMTKVGGLTVHWDGSRWTMVGKSHPEHWLFDISADSPDDVWVAGEGIISRWNGRHWRTIPDAPLYINAVDVRSPDDVWLAGAVNGEPPPSQDAAVFHWDGHDITQADLPEVEASSHLDAISVVGADDIWTVGDVVGPKGHD